MHKSDYGVIVIASLRHRDRLPEYIFCSLVLIYGDQTIILCDDFALAHGKDFLIYNREPIILDGSSEDKVSERIEDVRPVGMVLQLKQQRLRTRKTIHPRLQVVSP